MTQWDIFKEFRRDFTTEIDLIRKSKYLFVFFLITIGLRIIISFFGPLATTDLARSLFYGKHFWKYFFDVYSLTPLEIDPNFNIVDPTTGLLAWPDNAYDYPIFSIGFFALFGLLPFGLSTKIVLVKLVYTGFDFINFILLRSLDNEKSIPWFYWIIMIPFTNIEGQPAAVTVFCFIFAIWLYKRIDSPISAFSMVAIGFHWKYISLALLPYFCINTYKNTIWGNIKDKSCWIAFLKPIFYFMVIFTIFWFPVLVSPYALQYISFGGNLPVQSLPWNPFYLGSPFSVSSYLLLFIMILIGMYTIIEIRKEESTEEWWNIANYIPLTVMLLFLLIYKYGFPWYWMWITPLFTLIPERTLKKTYFKIYIVICTIAAVEFIHLTTGFIGFFEFINTYIFLVII